MKSFAKALACAALAACVFSTAVAPAWALGGCGPNMHRGYNGRCYWGGQNQAWCLRHTGHVATRMPNGEMICFR